MYTQCIHIHTHARRGSVAAVDDGDDVDVDGVDDRRRLRARRDDRATRARDETTHAPIRWRRDSVREGTKDDARPRGTSSQRWDDRCACPNVMCVCVCVCVCRAKRCEAMHGSTTDGWMEWHGMEWNA